MLRIWGSLSLLFLVASVLNRARDSPPHMVAYCNIMLKLLVGWSPFVGWEYFGNLYWNYHSLWYGVVVGFGFLVGCVGWVFLWWVVGWRRVFGPGGLSLFGVTLGCGGFFPSFSPCWLVSRSVGGVMCVLALIRGLWSALWRKRRNKRGTTRVLSRIFFYLCPLHTGDDWDFPTVVLLFFLLCIFTNLDRGGP